MRKLRKKRLTLRDEITKSKEQQKPKSGQYEAHVRKRKLLMRRAKSRLNYENEVSSKEPTPEKDASATTTNTTTTDAPTTTTTTTTTESDTKEPDQEFNVKNASIMVLSDEEEAKLEVLEEAFLTTDKNFEGLIPHEKFMDCLRDANLELENEMDKMYLLKFISTFEQGIDYYGFIRQIRYIGSQENKGILQVIDLFVQEQKNIEAGVATKTHYTSPMPSNSTNKEDKTTSGRHRRFSSCASIQELDPTNPLTQLIEDLALDGADVDLALLKTAFSMIGLQPNEDDMEFIVLYLCTDDSGFVDFRYFLQFVQENYESDDNSGSGFDVSKAITAVANQLRIYVREEERRKEQQEKIKQRLSKKEKLNSGDKQANELVELEKEEQRLRSLRLKQKVRQYR